MTIAERNSEEKLRQGFKQFNKGMLLMWRLGMGNWVNAWPEVGGRIMVLTHIGRKTGLTRRTPVNYAIADGDVYCTAGFGDVADWYQNIKANPAVEVWLPDGWYAGEAEEVVEETIRVPLLREVLIASGYAAKAAGIDPVAITSEELDAATKDYRLIRIRRTEARTGPGGPGDLAWVWPVATLFLLLNVIFRRRKS